MEIYNSLGELVAEPVNKLENAGNKQVVWNAQSLSSGIYIMRMNAEAIDGGKKFSSMKKLILLK